MDFYNILLIKEIFLNYLLCFLIHDINRISENKDLIKIGLYF